METVRPRHRIRDASDGPSRGTLWGAAAPMPPNATPGPFPPGLKPDEAMGRIFTVSPFADTIVGLDFKPGAAGEADPPAWPSGPIVEKRPGRDG